MPTCRLCPSEGRRGRDGQSLCDTCRERLSEQQRATKASLERHAARLAMRAKTILVAREGWAALDRLGSR